MKRLAFVIAAVLARFLAARPSRDAAALHKVNAAGCIVKTARVNGVTLSYVEGPDNGPPLVLLHAQLLDWFSYSRVMPALAQSFHLFVIDYPGHGETAVPADYEMTADRIGTDLGDFIEQRVGKPVFISGNSSGGLLATWLAAYRPSLIRAVVLEDPPLFSSRYPRIQTTIAYRVFKTSHTAATRDHPEDFLLYWIRSNAAFFRKRVGPGVVTILTQTILAYRKRCPDQPVEIAFIKNDTVRLMLRGLDQYDPRFGAAFYDGSWNRDFDHIDALQRIRCPTLLMQANTTTLPDGTLAGAMSDADAEQASSLLLDGVFVKVDAGHVINIEKPDLFVATLRDFFLREQQAYERSTNSDARDSRHASP